MDIGNLYFSAQGRLNRQAYWLATIPLFILSVFLETTTEILHESTILMLYLILIVSGYMIAIKRCHDRNKSGWWILLSFIPLVGLLWTLVELGCLKGSDGDNEYGTDPLADL
jgi:uncharacterized membrane protein YhaH (DUF805 family)